MGNDLKERYLKTICNHLEDIAKSLRILSERENLKNTNIVKQESYADKYFKTSVVPAFIPEERVNK